MSVLTFIDIGLSALVITVAASTISMRELFAAVVSYVAYGLLLAFVWIRLYAPDVALTEAAVGGGVTGVLLITAGKRLVPLRRTATEAELTLTLKVLAGIELRWIEIDALAAIGYRCRRILPGLST